MKKLIFLFAICFLFIFMPFLSSNSQDNVAKNQIKNEEIDKYIKEWLDSPIRYIITNKEEKAFKKLKKREEKIRFINYFWMRRDPNPDTPAVEFRDEFYKRVVESNQFFRAGNKEGWKTDRGKIYIILGPPDEQQTGVTDKRTNLGDWRGIKSDESGAIGANMLRYEVWTYHSLPTREIPSNYSITFIDWYGNKNYMLDSASFHGKGEFEQEMDKRFYMARSGLVPKELGAGIEDIKKRSIVNKDLKLKDVPISTEIHKPLPFRLYRTFFSSDKSEANVLLGINFSYNDITFRESEEKKVNPSIAITASLSDEQKNEIDSFEDKLDFALDLEEFNQKSSENFIYWHCLKAKPGKYLLSIKAEDIFSHANSEWQKEIDIPSFLNNEFMFSEVILADAIIPALEIQDDAVLIDTISMLGHRITPNMDAMFYEGSQLCLFFQVMNLQLDSESSKPLATIKCYIYKDNKVFRIINPPDSSFTFREPNEILASFCIPLQDFPLGEYSLSLIAVDKIANKEISRKINFEIIESN
jgi:GWxTD domain-containing protein